MKILKLSMVAALAVGACSVVNADTLEQALKNGKVSGEVTATYEQRSFDKEQPGADKDGYYQDTAYSVGSFALKYETATWNNLSLTSKFRAYKTLFEDDDTSYKGAGDASERFYETGKNRNIDAEELFLTYTPSKNVTVKAGRQFISSHWVNKTNDAVKIDASFGDTSLEAIWAMRHGRVYARDFRPMERTNEKKGIYQVALTHKFNDSLSVTAYDRMEPTVRDIMGVKVNGKIAEVSFGAHYAITNEDKETADRKDTDLIHLTASTSIAGFSPYVGYIKVGDEAEDVFWTTSGETIDPMEEGDYIYKKGAETYYLGVSKSFGDLSATLLYGATEYLSGSNKKLTMDETTLWLGYPLVKNLKANLGYTVVNETEDATHGDYNQLNTTLTYSF